MTAVLPLSTLQAWLEDGDELAFIDIREEGLFGENHPLLAVNVPYSKLETDLPPRVPRRATRTVLLAENSAQGALAARRLAALGYTAVHLLDGGLEAWRQAGLALFQGINVPSKAFAECVEHSLHTPAIEAAELAKLIDAQADYALLDSRTLEEYQRFHVPTAVGVPSAELLYRFDDLVPSADTLVVVSCAGRTRGIVGAQTLINAGVPNRVVALAGGTQGWRLAGLHTVNHDSRHYGPLSGAARDAAVLRAERLAERHGVARVNAATLASWQADPQRTTYLFDVRSAEEFAHSHRADARHVPGGQLVQALDLWVATRNARIVLNDDDGVRATTTAHWLAQLGWQASVLVGIDPAANARPVAQPSWAGVQYIDPATAAGWLKGTAVALAADRSAAYAAHAPHGALWVNRARLAGLPARLKAASQVLVFAEDLALARGVALELHEQGLPAYVVTGDAAQWRAAGIVVGGNPPLADAERLDYLFWLHDRHDGNAEASAAYIAWEEDLPRQVGDHRHARFQIRP
ncbi:rhodanese-like domain-containing protein [Pseudomonas sp. NPDC007930]|uniref:rhodanese-like domain-containing protein n=1 Tax=Pseudomonas sp. NPDC007930 TaxID=3364417 RepID=UPI0036EC1EF4